ncbi:MAG: hypothetical protein M1831_002374 [Alyxoria varia]|nr:MAG: hypothetical protein M1831_002374 [Alyxoria varia]
MIVAQTRPTARLLSRRLRAFTTSTLHQERTPLSKTGRHDGFAQRRPKPPPPPPPSRPPTVPQPNKDNHNDLIAPVSLPHDRHAILGATHASTSILANSTIVVQRKLELMNVLAGFEQANRYVIMDGNGEHIGYMAERDHGIGQSLARQAFRTHRSFTAHVFDRDEVEILRIHRPFSWINSKIKVYDAMSGDTSSADTPQDITLSPSDSSNTPTAKISDSPTQSMRVIGESQQQWAPLRRKYNLFLSRPLSPQQDTQQQQLTAGDLPLSTSTALQTTSPTPDGSSESDMGFAQFAYIDSPFLSWDFSLLSGTGIPIGDISRNFRGLAREIFTDTGAYALRMDSASASANLPEEDSTSRRKEAGMAADKQIQEVRTTAEKEKEKQIQDTTTGMTLDQRAVMLATAISVDFDFFSRHSGPAGGGGFFPLWFPMGGGGGAEAGAAGAEAGAAEAGAGAGAAEGTAAGEGAMAGEAAEGEEMWGQGPSWGQAPPAGEEEVWGQSGGWGDGGSSSGGGGGGSGGGGGGGGGGDGGGFDIGDWI